MLIAEAEPTLLFLLEWIDRQVWPESGTSLAVSKQGLVSVSSWAVTL